MHPTPVPTHPMSKSMNDIARYYDHILANCSCLCLLRLLFHSIILVPLHHKRSRVMCFIGISSWKGIHNFPTIYVHFSHIMAKHISLFQKTHIFTNYSGFPSESKIAFISGHTLRWVAFEIWWLFRGNKKAWSLEIGVYINILWNWNENMLQWLLGMINDYVNFWFQWKAWTQLPHLIGSLYKGTF